MTLNTHKLSDKNTSRLLLLPGKFEDNKVVLILRQTTQWLKAKGIHNNLQNTTQKTKDRAA